MRHAAAITTVASLAAFVAAPLPGCVSIESRRAEALVRLAEAGESASPAEIRERIADENPDLADDGYRLVAQADSYQDGFVFVAPTDGVMTLFTGTSRSATLPVRGGDRVSYNEWDINAFGPVTCLAVNDRARFERETSRSDRAFLYFRPGIDFDLPIAGYRYTIDDADPPR